MDKRLHFSLIALVILIGAWVGFYLTEYNVEAPKTELTEEQPTQREITSSEKPSPTQDEPSVDEKEEVEQSEEVSAPGFTSENEPVGDLDEPSVDEVGGTDFIEPSYNEIIDMMFAYNPNEQVDRYLTREEASKYLSLVENSLAELDSDVDPLWIVAMMWQESRFYSEAKSHAGAIGLLQIMPNTGSYYNASPSDLYNPQVNIPVGIEYLDYLQSYYEGSLRWATIAYNQGMGNVDRGTYKTWYYTDVKAHYDRMAEMLR